MTDWLSRLTGDVADLADRYDYKGTHGPGLYVQLRQATGSGGSLMEGKIGRSHPHSRPPGRFGIVALIVSIDVDSRVLYQNLGGQHPPQDTRQVLRRLPDRAAACPAELQRAAKQVGRWHTSARTALTWLAPVMTLHNPCPYCGSRTLRTRSDASTDVWCGNDEVRENGEPVCLDPETGREYRWPRSKWAFLLMQMTEETG